MPLEISIREFARREGVSDTLVRRGIKEGRIKALPSGKLDADLVGSGWRQGANTANTSANTTANSANTANRPRSKEARLKADDDETLEQAARRFMESDENANLDYAEALRRKENYLGLLRQLEYDQKSGALVPIDEVKEVLFDEFRALRDAWLNWPTRIGPLMASDLGLEPEPVIEALTNYVYKHLDEIGESPDDKRILAQVIA